MKTFAGLLSTGEVARLSGYSPSAVLNWIRTGKLRAYSSPGHRHRVDPKDLLRVMREHGMRIPEELAATESHRILVIGGDATAREAIADLLRQSELACTVETAEAGILDSDSASTFRPHAIIVEATPLALDGVELCRSIKASSDFAGTKLLVVTTHPDYDQARKALGAGADDLIAKPVSAELLVKKMSALLGVECRATAPHATAQK